MSTKDDQKRFNKKMLDDVVVASLAGSPLYRQRQAEASMPYGCWTRQLRWLICDTISE